MSKLKLIFSFILCLVICFASVIPASADYNSYLYNVSTYSDCYLLICTDNDEIVFSKNMNKQTHPASLTKVITAAVVLENCSNIEQVIAVPESCIRELDGTGSSMSGLKAGEELSIHNLLYCLLLQSANEAATTLADFICPGNRQKFIDKMNKLAEKLGCDNSHFVNPHGLDDDDQYVTAADMAKFFEYAYSFPVFAQICSTTEYQLPQTNLQGARDIKNTNFTMFAGYKEYYCKYINGGKTGSTSIAGHCLVSHASRDGYNYICVCLNAPKYDMDKDGYAENGAFLDTKMMYEWAIDNLNLVLVADSDRICGELPIKYSGSTDTIPLCAKEKVYTLIPKNTDKSSLLIKIEDDEYPGVLKAPIKKGDYICKARIYYADNPITEIELVASKTVKRGILAFLVTGILELVTSFTFIIIFFPTVIIVVLIYLIYAKKKREKDSRKYKVLSYRDFFGDKK